MKKLFAALCALLMVLSLTACGKKEEEPVVDNTENQTEVENQTEESPAMSYEEYAAAELDSEVVLDLYAQNSQSWWDGKITVYGYKSEWSGEVEVVDGTFTKLSQTYTAAAVNADDKFGDNDALLPMQNQLVAFTGLTVDSISYKNDEPGDDIYLTFSKDGKTMDFCVEVYLTGTDSDVYTTVGELSAGDVVDVEGFLYWYNGANPHITSIVKK